MYSVVVHFMYIENVLLIAKMTRKDVYFLNPSS